MRFFSEAGIMIATVLVVSIAWANQPATDTKASDKHGLPASSKTYTAKGTTDLKTAQMLVNLLRNPHLKVKATANLPKTPESPTYTAHGKVDRKTALMLLNLLRNPHLQVKAEVHKVASKPPMQNRANANMATYSISGKTNISTVKKLQALLKNNKQIQIKVSAKRGAKKSDISFKGRPSPAMQQYRYQDYSALISQGRSFYHNGRPPVFIRGNTLWYPVPVNTQPTSNLNH